ncbi:MAG: metallophosphatase family protein [Thermodesulfovibrio sp.]|nr:metallophosphatase family protein [Thermodesulfovibrio sp.]
MRLGIFGDIHGNMEALKVAHKAIIDSGVDKIFHLGDLGGYAPHVNEVIDFLMEHRIEGVQGNYDEAIALYKENCGCKYENEFQAHMMHLSFEWTKNYATNKSKNYMKLLPFKIDFEAEDKKISLFHATPIKNNLYWYEDRLEKFFLLMAEKSGADIMIYGHTHIPYFKRIDDKYFINAGSVGKPKDGDPRACVCIIDIYKSKVEVQFIRKEYDLQRMVRAIIDSGLPYYFAEKLSLAR